MILSIVVCYLMAVVNNNESRIQLIKLSKFYSFYKSHDTSHCLCILLLFIFFSILPTPISWKSNVFHSWVLGASLHCSHWRTKRVSSLLCAFSLCRGIIFHFHLGFGSSAGNSAPISETNGPCSWGEAGKSCEFAFESSASTSSDDTGARQRF